MKDYEEVSDLTLDREDQDSLLRTQNECVFVWRRSDGWPVGVVMSCVWRDGKVWLTASSQRPRVAAIRRDNRVSVAISSAGTRMPPATITIRGRCAVLQDAETKSWFYPALAAALIPEDEKQQAGFVAMLDSPRRVVMCVTPEHFITFDGRKMGQLGVSSGS
ncbi:MAG: pyridoxamine 5'-phosphate oxidase family protein [Deltaproteobacteria bacterium]|jgi:general stress protein 26|nr:pyridoxamine 5'-phosphate oxidase family protein [Deltaproteobacteria bacterium]